MSVFLSRNNLESTIPSELLDIPTLRVLRLDVNSLSGTIPKPGSSPLETLNLFWNKLQGEIPSELGKLSNSFSGYLTVSHNDLDGKVPTELGYLTKMTSL